MARYTVTLNYSDGVSEDLDDVFYSYEEAEEAAMQAASDYAQGCMYLEEAGEEYCEAEVEDWDISELVSGPRHRGKGRN